MYLLSEFKNQNTNGLKYDFEFISNFDKFLYKNVSNNTLLILYQICAFCVRKISRSGTLKGLYIFTLVILISVYKNPFQLLKSNLPLLGIFT